MNDLDATVHRVLHHTVAALDPTPDFADLRRRRQRRLRRRRLTTTAAAALLVVVAGAVVVSRDSSPRPMLAGGLSKQACVTPAQLPFHPVGLDPDMWTGNSYNRAQGLGLWTGPGERIEVWNAHRGELPNPASNIETITILGRTALIGDISDGYSAVFQLGPTSCDRWALVAHPGTTRQELHDIAVALQPN